MIVMLVLKTIRILSLYSRSWGDCVCPEDMFSNNKHLSSSAVERDFHMSFSLVTFTITLEGKRPEVTILIWWMKKTESQRHQWTCPKWYFYRMVKPELEIRSFPSQASALSFSPGCFLQCWDAQNKEDHCQVKVWSREFCLTAHHLLGLALPLQETSTNVPRTCTSDPSLSFISLHCTDW